MNLPKLKAELNSLANQQKAKILQRFFKTGKGEYAEGDIFLGITVPKQREVVKKYLNLPLSDISKLLKSKIHEHRLVALLILVKNFSPQPRHHPELRVQPRSEGSLKKYQERDSSDALGMEKQKIYNFYLVHTKHINNWDLVDCSASNIVGQYLFEISLLSKERLGEVMIKLIKLAHSQNLWERRIAIVSTFYFIKNKNPEPTLKIAKILLNDKHDLIHKACGWMLREVGKKCGEKKLTEFLDRYAKKMPRTMLRYTIERLPEKLKNFYLNK